MKRIVSLFLIFVFVIGSEVSPVFAHTYQYSEKGLIIEAEDMSFNNASWSIIEDGFASEGKAFESKRESVFKINGTLPTNGDSPTLSASFALQDFGEYYIWIRYCALSDGSDSVFLGLDNNTYKNTMFNSGKSYEWINIFSGKLEKGEHIIKFIERERLLRIDQLVITTNPLFMPNGILSDTNQIVDSELVSKWNNPVVYPPENTHPRVFFRESDKVRILNNINDEEHKKAKELLTKNAMMAVPNNRSKYESWIGNVIEAKAFYYSLYGDEEIGREAIELGKSIFDYDLSGLETRSIGRIINIISEMYDWCYDLFENYDEKRYFILKCVRIAGKMEIGWPPSLQNSLTGHGSESQLLRDLLSFAIAVYDERPDIWNYIGGRFYAEYVPARQFANKGFYNNQGSNYGYYRHQYDSYAYKLITGMGADEPYSGEDLCKVSYSQIYMRRPDGTFMADGDMYLGRMPEFNYAKVDIAGLLLDSSVSDDPYIKNEYYRQTISVSDGNITQSFVDNSPVLYLIVNNPNVETKTIYDMPLSMYCPSPTGMMIARTGWQDGIKSDSVVAAMKIGGYMFNNHQHLDAGSFQIYYKGILASESGEYDSYGTTHHSMYTSKSIAHNTMLVYDPDEDKDKLMRGNINDGGQRAVNYYGEFNTLNKLLGSNAEVGKVIAHEIDAGDNQTHAFSYIKGDLTNAYTDKVNDYKKSFVFINTENSSVPAVMIVFDKLKVKNPEFKKIWLMHGEQKPVVNGSRSVFINDNFGYNGKMTIDTLLPTADNTEFSIEGGVEEGWSLVNKHIYNGNGWTKTKIADYIGSDLSTENEANTYRLEISPKTPQAQDCFLNVIQISDNGSPEVTNAGLFENDLFYGAEIENKKVLFSKDGKLIGNDFTVESDGVAEYIICDIEQGEYSVTDSKGTEYVYSSAEGGVLNFTAEGNVSIRKIDKSQNSDISISVTDDSNDSAYIKYKDKFLYTKVNPVKICGSDEFFVPISIFSDNFNVYAKKKENSVYLYQNDTNKFIAEILPNEDVVTFLGKKQCSQKPYIDKTSGEIMININDIAYAMGLSVTYDKYSKILFIENTALDKAYINYIPLSDGLKINIYENSGYNADYIAAVFNNGKLLKICGLEKSDSGMYSGVIPQTDGFTDVKIFSWNADKLFPLDSAKRLSPLKGKSTVYSTADETLKISHSAGIKYTKIKDDIIQYEKTSDKTEERFLLGTGNIYLGYETDRRWLYYSSMIESKNISESMQIRIRSNISQKVLYVFTPSAGKKYKLDVILDLREMKAYVYINGKCVSQTDISGLKGSNKNKSAISWIEHYYTGSKVSGGIRTIQGAFVSIYDGNISFEEIEKGIINGIMVMEDSNEN